MLPNILIILFCSYLSSNQNLKQKIETNYFSFDEKSHYSIINEIEDSLKTNVNDEKYYYYLGLEYHILGKIQYNPNPKKAKESFNKSLEFLEKISKRKKTGDVSALISSIYGKIASLTFMTSFYWGYKSKDLYYEAYYKDSLSPKVLLIGAIHLMHLPKSFGGDKNKAEKFLNLALKNIYNNNDDLINWAKKEEIYSYFAQLYILKKNYKKAEYYINESLKIQKNNDFILIDLKKQMDK